MKRIGKQFMMRRLQNAEKNAANESSLEKGASSTSPVENYSKSPKRKALKKKRRIKI